MDRNALGERLLSLVRILPVAIEVGIDPQRAADRRLLVKITLQLSRDWEVTIQDAESGNPREFLEYRMTDIDTALFTDPDQLAIEGTHNFLFSSLVRRLQDLSMQELKEKGLERITPENSRNGNCVAPHWLEEDVTDSVPTSDQTLDQTFAEIRPGKGGFRLRLQDGGKALRPSVARFYRYAPQN